MEQKEVERRGISRAIAGSEATEGKESGGSAQEPGPKSWLLKIFNNNVLHLLTLN